MKVIVCFTSRFCLLCLILISMVEEVLPNEAPPALAGCILSIHPQERRGPPVELQIRVHRKRFWLGFVRGGKVIIGELVGLDRREQEAGSFFAMDVREPVRSILLSPAGFHFTLRDRNRYQTYRFRPPPYDMLFEDLQSNCDAMRELHSPLKKDVAFDPTGVQFINWLVDLNTGRSTMPDQAARFFGEDQRTAVEDALTKLLGKPQRAVDSEAFRALLLSAGFRLPPLFDSAESFDGGFAAVSIRDKWGLIGSNGYWIIEPRFDALRVGESATFAVKQDARWGLASPKTVITEAIYDDVRACSNGLCAFRQGLKWGFLTKFGAVGIRPSFDDVRDFKGDYAAVRSGQRWFLIDQGGNSQTPPIIARTLNSPVENRLSFQREKAGFFDINSMAVVAENFDSVKEFSEGMAAVEINGVWGFIDAGGNLAISPQFRAAKDFKESAAAVQAQSGYWGYIGLDGNWVLKPQFISAGEFSEGLAWVSVNVDARLGFNRYGLINHDGQLVYPAVFEDALNFRQGLAAVRILNRWGYLDRRRLK
ncbi:WG repeat-containing protein [Jiella pelagia]|uniref:WG repeat-containing protein n=1 Tax=Jiella pelagia TaxID=2986949 RepID=A0ABY7C581_9HYPH|nr:WG repeat-containing protein [Jiella pelagia]WAP70371.1 WG repeat-containing protein [Jiella pelagia]